jgi:NAD(P)-dependent dehydrogenase (short-subunit alcohol dehydrogenase family)
MSWKFKVFGSFLVVVAITITLFYNQYVLAPISYQPTDLSDAVIIVTGGTSGIGLETVRKFVEWNGTVIMPVRNLRKGEIVKKEILSTSMHLNHKGKIELIEMDLTSFASVRNFATKILERKIHIDILVLNAVVFLLFFDLIDS